MLGAAKCNRLEGRGPSRGNAYLGYDQDVMGHVATTGNYARVNPMPDAPILIEQRPA